MYRLGVVFSLVVFGASVSFGQKDQIRISAQEDEVPEGVVGSFKQDFTKVSKCAWVIVTATVVGEEYSVDGAALDGIGNPTYYEVSFNQGVEKEAAVYDHYGKLVQSKKMIKESGLPEIVRHTVASSFPDYNFVSDQEAVAGNNKMSISHYRVHLKSGAVTKLIVLDASGKLLKEK